MFSSDLAKLTCLVYIGLILADGASSQGWMDGGFPDWPEFGQDFDDFEKPFFSDWDFGFGNGVGGFFGRMMRDSMRRSEQQMRFGIPGNQSPGMSRLLQDARSALEADQRPGFRRVVRTISCGPGCHIKAVVTRENGAYSERVFQSSY